MPYDAFTCFKRIKKIEALKQKWYDDLAITDSYDVLAINTVAINSLWDLIRLVTSQQRWSGWREEPSSWSVFGDEHDKQ